MKARLCFPGGRNFDVELEDLPERLSRRELCEAIRSASEREPDAVYDVDADFELGYRAVLRTCPFCDFKGELLRDFGDVIVLEPLNPVTLGHVLVVPKTHVADFVWNPRLSARVMEMAALYAREAGLGSCNLITSRGPEATQTVFHLHVHLVPRHEGDGLMLPWSD